jgi:hypothetical protein
LPENVARDWNGTDAVPNRSSGGRWLLAPLAAHCAVGGVALLVNALHAGGGGEYYHHYDN